MQGSEIERIAAPSQAEFARLERRGRPCVLVGALDSWGALSRWEPATLARVAGDVPVLVSVAEDRRFGVDPQHDRRIERMPFGEYLERSFLREEPERRYYLQKYPVRHLPALAADFSTPAGVPRRRAFDTTVWISRRESLTPLHFDLTEGLLAQVRGEKQVALFPPGIGRYYPHRWPSLAPHFSRVDPARPDPVAFPRFRGAGRIDCRLLPGELLYIPSSWWHEVRSCSEVNVSLSFWWLPRAGRLLRRWRQALRAVPLEAYRRWSYGGGLPDAEPKRASRTAPRVAGQEGVR